MKSWSLTKKILIGFVVLFLLAPTIQPPKNYGQSSGPNDITQTAFVPDSVLAILKSSCYDCHSENTTYPWYDHLTPVNWWINHHIDEGKKELNFTVFKNYSARKQAKKFDEIAEVVEEDEMPLDSYLIMHGDAKLSSRQRQLIIEWAKSEEARIRINTSRVN